MADNTVPLTRGKRQIAAARFKEAAQVRNEWVITPEEGTPFEAVLREDYWSHIASRLRPCDIIEVHAEDATFFARLYVRTAGRLWAKVAVMEFVDFTKDAPVAVRDTGHEVKWKGPHMKWAVIRTADKEAVQGGFENKEIAAGWLADYLKQVAA